jgi:hypothetical protein
MIAVAGIWELGWNCPLSESWLWTFPLREYGVTSWAMSPKTGIQQNERHAGMVLSEYDQYQEMIERFHPELTRVYVDEAGDTMLQNFVHPENALYIFGNAGTSPISSRKPGEAAVRVETLANGSVMWPHQCLVAVLHDRLVKSWR